MIRNLVQSTLSATRRALAWDLKSLTPPSEKELFTFASATDFKHWDVYADSNHGGLTTASFGGNEDGTGTGKHGDKPVTILLDDLTLAGVLAGNLSLDLAEDSDPRIKRSGFAGIRSTEGTGIIDLDPFDTIAFRLKGDGRCYISSIRTDNWVGGPSEEAGNTWQALLFAPKDEWHVVKIPFSRYVPTWRGRIVDDETAEMNPARVMGLGLAVAAQGGFSEAVTGPGPFRLELEWIKALRTPSNPRASIQ